jgi:hypothetical protein
LQSILGFLLAPNYTRRKEKRFNTSRDPTKFVI